MKILKRENITQEKLTQKADTLQFTLPERLTGEEAKERHLKVYVNTDFKQVIRKEVYDFIFLKVISRRVLDEHGEITDRMYIVTLWAEDELIEAEMDQKEFFNGKWLKELITLSVLFMPRQDYLMLIKSLSTEDDKLFYFDKIGIHKLDGRYYYAASNCAVTADGIRWDIRSRQEGFSLNLGPNGEPPGSRRKEAIRSFIKYSGWRYDVFYPIHCIPLLAILQYFLKMYGNPAGAILWIDGSVGSGKTQLSTTMGDFFNRGSSHGISSHSNSPKARYNEISKNLSKYRNAVFILDDIKKEESSRNRENSKNITDFLIRSIYRGKMDSPDVEGEEVDASAIITGEFFKEQTSTISRVLYLQINNFLNEKENSSHFKEIQDDPYYLAEFMYFFLKWLLKKMENMQEVENLCLDLENLKQQKELNDTFQGKAIGSRMIETVADFQLVSVTLNKFFKDCGFDEYLLKSFLEKSKKALLELGGATYRQSLDQLPFYKQVLMEVLNELNIKDCRYEKEFIYHAIQIEKNPEYYNDNLHLIMGKLSPALCLDNEDSLDDFGQMWLYGMQKCYDGIFLKYGDEETLLVSKDVICNKIKERISKYNEKNHSFLYPSQYTDTSILEKLAKSQSIYGYKRDDGFRKFIKFPVYNIIPHYDSYEQKNCYIYIEDTCTMLKINTDEINCSNLKTSFHDLDLEEFSNLASKFKSYLNCRGRHACSDEKKAYDNAIREMNRCIDLM